MIFFDRSNICIVAGALHGEYNQANNSEYV